jgi:hypothetical protein
MGGVDGIINDSAKLVYRQKAHHYTRFHHKIHMDLLRKNGDLGRKNPVTSAFSGGMFTFDPRRKIFMYLQQRA